MKPFLFLGTRAEDEAADSEYAAVLAYSGLDEGALRRHRLERDMLPEDETFLRHYSLAGLYERLREDAALYPDTMEQRPVAWGDLLLPALVAVLVMAVLHVLISIVMPLRWQSIRASCAT